MATKRGLLLVAACIAQLAALGGAAQAAANLMTTGGRATQPVGHYYFCKERPIECNEVTPNAHPLPLTRALWAEIVNVNNEVNARVQPRTDEEIWGREEVWSYPTRYGDCEDYVLEKRRLLMEAGIPAGNLLITVVKQPNGDGHAVLTVNTDRGDYILDNLNGRVRAWTDTPYTYLKRQSTRNSGVWVTVNDGRSIAVGSVSN